MLKTIFLDEHYNPSSRHTKEIKMVLDTALLNTQRYKVFIKGKVDQSRERRSSYWKGPFWLPSTTVANFTYTALKMVPLTGRLTMFM